VDPHTAIITPLLSSSEFKPPWGQIDNRVPARFWEETLSEMKRLKPLILLAESDDARLSGASAWLPHAVKNKTNVKQNRGRWVMDDS
jgi:hypothetical protein